MLQALIPFYAVLFIALGLLTLMAALTGTFDHTVAKGLNLTDPIIIKLETKY